MISDKILPWSVIETNRYGDKVQIARFDLLMDAELFVKHISARMPGYSYFITRDDGVRGETWQGGHLVK